MILEEKSQELKRRRWLTEINDEVENERGDEKVKRIKIEETHEVKVINRIWALPLEDEINVNKDVCIFRAPVAGGILPNDIRYPCFLDGPSTTGFSRARDLMSHSVSNHDLFPSKVQQGKHYICDGRDLIAPTHNQYDRYKDWSHRGKKKLDDVENTEEERRLAKARTKAGEKAKRGAMASTSKEVDVAAEIEMMRRREVQVEIQNAEKAEARKRDEQLEEKRVAVEKKIQLEEQQKNREEKKRKVKEEWQKNLRLVEEEKKREDKIQIEKSLAKTLALEGDRSEAVAVKKVARKEMTSAELDQEFRELNAAQMRVNTRAAVDQIVGEKWSGRKETEKSGTPGLRMMRAEGEMGDGSCLPPVSAIFGPKTRGAGAVDNVKSLTEKRGKKVISIPAPVVEEMELESGGEEVDFEKEQRDDVRVEIPQDILKVMARSVTGEQKGGEIKPVVALYATFLRNLVSDRMEIDLGEEYEKEIQEIVQNLEESGKEAGLNKSPSRAVKEELIEREGMSRESRKTGDGKVSSDSAEEVERIVIDDRMEGESYMIRTVGQEEGDEPAPLRDILTPVLESTPCEGHEKEGRKAGFRPLTAPKKQMWVQPEPKERETEEEEDEKSSSGESSASKRSPLSMVKSGRLMVPENEVPIHLREPRGYGDRATRVHVRFNDRTGLREVSSVEEGDEMLTGGGDGDRDLRVRRVTARSWLEGNGSDEEDGIEDLDDQLYRIIDATPLPSTISRALRIAV